MQVLKAQALEGPYALATTEHLPLAGVGHGMAGKVRIAAGTRSPPEGRRASATHELGYVVSGRLLVETATQQHEVAAGDILVMSPAEDHSTTALEDSEIFFVLLDPLLAPAR